MRNTNIKIAILSIAVLAAVLSLTAAVIAAPREAARAQDVEQSLSEYKYIVREHNGYVAVFPPAGGETPSYVTKMPVALLPDMDRLSLEKGIKIKTEAELTSILEDFTS